MENSQYITQYGVTTQTIAIVDAMWDFSEDAHTRGDILQELGLITKLYQKVMNRPFDSEEIIATIVVKHVLA